MLNSNSLERMLSVISLFTEDRLEWTSEEMIERLGYSRPTLYRYLKILSEAGFLSSMPPGRFTLGPKVVELDYLLRMSDPFVLSGRQTVDWLAETYSCTAMLMRWYRDKILCVYSACSMAEPLSSYPRGRPMELGRGAIARSIIANLPRRQSLPLVEKHLDDYRDVGFGNSIEEIYAGLRQIRKQRVCVAHGEVTPGVVGTSAPVFDAGSRPIGAICVTVSAEQTTDAVLGEIAESVKAASTQVSARLQSTAR